MELNEGFHKRHTILDLFRPRVIAMRSINMFYQWFSVTVAYYGITFASTTLSGDPYTNFALASSTDLLSMVAGFFTIHVFGRRYLLVFVQLLSGVSCIAAGMLMGNEDLAWLQIALVMLGKFGAGLSFGICYLLTAELFPTSIRTTAMGKDGLWMMSKNLCFNNFRLL